MSSNRIWAKVMLGDKIKKDLIYTSDKAIEADTLQGDIANLCHELDIPTPVVLKSNVSNFFEFRITRFRSTDFVESVDFDMLVLEDATEAERK